MKNKVFIAVIIVGILALSAALLILQRKDNKTMQSSQNDQEAQGRLVANFPDFPIHTSIEIKSSRFSKDAQGEHFDVVLESDMSLPEIQEWYIQKLASNGWLLQQQEGDEGEDEVTLVFTKENMKAGIFIEHERAGETEMSINLTVMM